jgi:hypothetical protein
MTLKQSVFTVIGFGIGFAILGFFEGLLMGTFHPSYYRAYSPSMASFTDEELLSVAIGLGVENGLLLGLAIGFIIVIIMLVRELKLAKLSRDGSDTKNV